MNEHERINAAVKKYIDGDKKAFTEIYELTYQATYYYVIGAVKNKEAAEDIISDTYLEVVKSIGTLSSPKAFVSWLRTIAHSKICRYFKKNGREVLVTEEEEPIFDTLENENEEFIPAVALEKESDRNEIIRIINGLSDVQKQTVFMHYFDKMPVAEIAEAMECSENTVKSRLNYARKALKDMFVAEEKKGNKFYSVAPFMFMLFSEEVQAVRVSAELSKRIIESAEIGAAAGSGIIGTIKGFFSTAAGKFAAASTAAKAGIGVGVAAVVATACIVPAVVNDDEVVDVVEESSIIVESSITEEAETVNTENYTVNISKDQLPECITIWFEGLVSGDLDCEDFWDNHMYMLDIAEKDKEVFIAKLKERLHTTDFIDYEITGMEIVEINEVALLRVHYILYYINEDGEKKDNIGYEHFMLDNGTFKLVYGPVVYSIWDFEIEENKIGYEKIEYLECIDMNIMKVYIRNDTENTFVIGWGSGMQIKIFDANGNEHIYDMGATYKFGPGKTEYHPFYIDVPLSEIAGIRIDNILISDSEGYPISLDSGGCISADIVADYSKIKKASS